MKERESVALALKKVLNSFAPKATAYNAHLESISKKASFDEREKAFVHLLKAILKDEPNDKYFPVTASTTLSSLLVVGSFAAAIAEKWKFHQKWGIEKNLCTEAAYQKDQKNYADCYARFHAKWYSLCQQLSNDPEALSCIQHLQVKCDPIWMELNKIFDVVPADEKNQPDFSVVKQHVRSVKQKIKKKNNGI